ncbi:hypothetical protein I0C86_03695 [Plantactinospora sp. S1510]|uniref:DUF222 domain-containing protein n=1 Tax=Plantactinospora alkalitolerans TaxID=2789879 RepID=A0ABS0GPW4_9ACTN|nr:hypothetical protein [Plantactinospora alkalitolerans]MBF9128099.1 hypothetical protein [Plantactinospora alkalitolerans]
MTPMRHGDQPDEAATQWQSLADHAAVLAAAYGTGAERTEPLAALHLLGALRKSLDDAERQLLESARTQRASWAQIATSLGLGSRQAAEQRWLRLSGGVSRDPERVRVDRKRQRSIDTPYGPEIGRLRATVLAVHRQLAADAGLENRHPRAGLARTTLALAVSAEPGALFTLAAQAVDDLDTVPVERLPPPLPSALDRLRRAVSAATPPPGPTPELP